MQNIIEVEIQNSLSETETHIIIDHADGSYTSMLKSTYDAQQEQSTENPTEGDE